jgi:hypothetical protein
MSANLTFIITTSLIAGKERSALLAINNTQRR